MFCDQCGTKIEEGSAFCPNCGAPVPSQPFGGGQQGRENSQSADEGRTMAYHEDEGRTMAYHEDEGRTMAYHEDEGRTMAYHEDEGRTMAYHEDEGRTMAYHEDEGRTMAYHEDSDRTAAFRDGDQGYYGGYPEGDFGGNPSYGQDYYQQQPSRQPKNHKPWLYAVLGVAAVLFVVFIGIEVKTILDLGSEEEETVAEADSQEEEEQETDDLDEVPEETEEAVPQATPTSVPEEAPVTGAVPTSAPAPQTQSAPAGGYLDSDYIFPDSSTRELSESEFADKTEWELKVARNEIYARHGRMFDTPELDAHFRSKSWYVPSIPAAQFDDQSTLSTLEIKNATKILNYELAHGMET